jgi:hypothetical protein
MIVASAVKLLKGWNTLTVGADNLRIHDRGHINSCRFFHDQGIAIAPIVSIDRVEPNASIADMDLKPIAVVLQLVRPTRPAWRLLGDDWLTRMNEGGRRIHGPTA